MTELSRNEVLKMISKRIVQAIILSNHLKGDAEPSAIYVDEKANSWPVLDYSNSAVFYKVEKVLRSAYGIEINKRMYS